MAMPVSGIQENSGNAGNGRTTNNGEKMFKRLKHRTKNTIKKHSLIWNCHLYSACYITYSIYKYKDHYSMLTMISTT